MTAIRTLCAPSILALVAFLMPAVSQAKPAAVKPATATFKISNLTKATPAKEVKKVEKAVKKIKGVTFVAVAKKKGEIVVKHRPTADLAAVKDAIKKAGFTIVEPKEPEAGEEGDEGAGDEMGGEDTGGDTGDAGGSAGDEMADDAVEE